MANTERYDMNIDWLARLSGAMRQVRAPFALDFVVSGRHMRNNRATLPLRGRRDEGALPQ